MTALVRRPAAAGTFYPAEAEQLADTVDRLLSSEAISRDVPDPIGLVVPHAGYEYSGPVAATAYAALQARTAVAPPQRVVLLGPSHFVALRGAAVPAADAWATPLGTVEVDAELQRVAIAHGAARDDAPHRRDHALEVQLPFLQRILGSSFRVCPVAIGESETGEVASLIGALADSGAFVIVSTDLSHYHEHRTAQALDARSAEAVLSRDANALESGAACGVHALRGLVAHALERGHAFTLLDLRTSGDVTEERRRVVGYGAFALHRPPPARTPAGTAIR
jgi:AmmeMemoRadiSam system protein B